MYFNLMYTLNSHIPVFQINVRFKIKADNKHLTADDRCTIQSM